MDRYYVCNIHKALAKLWTFIYDVFSQLFEPIMFLQFVMQYDCSYSKSIQYFYDLIYHSFIYIIYKLFWFLSGSIKDLNKQTLLQPLRNLRFITDK